MQWISVSRLSCTPDIQCFTFIPLLDVHQTCSAMFIPLLVVHQTFSIMFIPLLVVHQTCSAMFIPLLVAHQTCSAMFIPLLVAHQTCSVMFIPLLVAHQTCIVMFIPLLVVHQTRLSCCWLYIMFRWIHLEYKFSQSIKWSFIYLICVLVFACFAQIFVLFSIHCTLI